MEMEEGAVEKGRIFISNNWAVYQMKLREGILSIIIVCERERERELLSFQTAIIIKCRCN